MTIAWLIFFFILMQLIKQSQMNFENMRYFDAEEGVVHHDIRDVLWLGLILFVFAAGSLTGLFVIIRSKK
jgi:hypothetical protein